MDGIDDSGFEEMMESAGLAPRGAQQGKEALIVRFFIRPQRNEKKSADAGRHIYEDMEMVDIRIPGDRDNLVRPASPEDKARFAPAYKAFKAGQEQTTASGMPLSEWSQITASLREELAFFGIRTVEQLANTPDSMLQRIGPLMALRQKAKDWLVRAKDDGILVKLRAENDQLAVRVSALEKMLEVASSEIKASRGEAPTTGGSTPTPSLSEIVAAVTKAMQPPAAIIGQPVPKKRGRPPKPKNGVLPPGA